MVMVFSSLATVDGVPRYAFSDRAYSEYSNVRHKLKLRGIALTLCPTRVCLFVGLVLALCGRDFIDFEKVRFILIGFNTPKRAAALVGRPGQATPTRSGLGPPKLSAMEDRADPPCLQEFLAAASAGYEVESS